MSAAACKTVLCLNGCLNGMVLPETKETTAAASLLAANNQLPEDQMLDLIDLYTKFEEVVERRKKEDKALLEKTKAIILG